MKRTNRTNVTIGFALLMLAACATTDPKTVLLAVGQAGNGAKQEAFTVLSVQCSDAALATMTSQQRSDCVTKTSQAALAAKTWDAALASATAGVTNSGTTAAQVTAALTTALCQFPAIVPGINTGSVSCPSPVAGGTSQ